MFIRHRYEVFILDKVESFRFRWNDVSVQGGSLHGGRLLNWKICVRGRTSDDGFRQTFGNGFGARAGNGWSSRVRQIGVDGFADGLRNGRECHGRVDGGS